MVKKVMVKKLGRGLASFVFLSLFYLVPYQIYAPRVNAFGCFDDCFNYVAGYFLLKGKILYSEIFFNHQPLMAYLSYLIQLFSQPINIYELILRHRQVVFGFGFLMNLLITWRFGLAGLGFALFYETSKFYLFGDRFLAEGLIVYPLVYLTGLVWFKYQRRKIYSFEYFLAAIFVWLVVFARLPFVTLAGVFFYLLIGGMVEIGEKKWAVVSLIGLALITLVFLPISDYFFSLVTVNLETKRIAGVNLLKSFFYPFYLFLGDEKNIFSNFLLGLDVVFLLTSFLNWRFLKKKKAILLMVLLLGLANLRMVEPGRIFYDAFHLLPWYGMFIFLIFLMSTEVFRFKKKLGFLFFSSLVLLFLSFILSPQFFAREKVDPHEEFMTHFGHELQIGEVVKNLSGPTDTLFLDGFDDLIYWQAGRLSSYPYSWYTSVMPHIDKYAEARLEMFAHNPPDFYYGTCPDKEVSFWMMPENVRNEYQPLYSGGKPTCLYIKKTKIPAISENQWQKAKEFLYELPEN